MEMASLLLPKAFVRADPSGGKPVVGIGVMARALHTPSCEPVQAGTKEEEMHTPECEKVLRVLLRYLEAGMLDVFQSRSRR